MSDTYTIFEALTHGWRMCMHGMRRSGRSERMTAMMDDGDVVVVASNAHGNHIKGLCKKQGLKDVVTLIIPSNLPTDEIYSRIRHTTHGRRRVFFEHTWVQCFIADRLDFITSDFEKLQEQLDGEYNAADRDTRRAREYRGESRRVSDAPGTYFRD